jgi:16S rRNA (guanine527-N7)-methyltransferase
MYNREWFSAICGKNKLYLSGQMLDQLELFHILLVEWNTKVNLISRKDEQNIWNRHILGSLAFLFHYRIDETCTILDLGTGGGLPGIPLAILYPNAKIVLLDSINKKTTAVKDIVTRINLYNIEIVNGRAEEVGLMRSYKNSVDYVITRAVSSVTDIIGWSNLWLHLTGKKEIAQKDPDDKRTPIPRGSIILLKGGNIQKEIEVAGNLLVGKKIITRELTMDNIGGELMPDKKVIIIHN